MGALGHPLRAVGRAVVYLVVLVAVLQGYSMFRKTYFVPPSEVAYNHAQQIIDLQSDLGLAVTRVELSLQRHALEHGWLVDFFNAYYRMFKPSLYVCAALCILLAPGAFRRYWRVFLVATLIALPWYAVYPLAPPRLMAAYGFPFVDTLAAYGGARPSSVGLGGANQFAAMPSMHIGWTTIAVFWLAAALPRWRIGLVVGVTHLALMCVAVVATGNHYVLDIIAGFAVVVLAFALARALRVESIRSARRALATRVRVAAAMLPMVVTGRPPPSVPPQSG